MILKLAWRNIWRNKRRTLITVASIFFAVLIAISMNSFQEGAYDQMIESAAGLYTGYAQVHQAGYWDDQTLENSFELSEALLEESEAHPLVSQAVPRLESFALASSEVHTKGCMVVGIDPGKEDVLTQLSKRVVEGKYLDSSTPSGALMGIGLAERLKLAVGDTLVLLGQGYHGVSAAGKYPVVGKVKLASPEMDKQMVYLQVGEAQYLYGADQRLTSVSLAVESPRRVQAIVNNLKTKLPEDYEVMSWQEMMPELVQMIEADRAGNVVTIGILYVIIAFGIFGTVLMMTAERKYEFGILTSIGMKKPKLAFTVTLELFFMSLIGVLAGALCSLPIVYYFNRNPVDMGQEAREAYEAMGVSMEAVIPMTIEPSIFLSEALTVFVMTLLIAIYPFWKILRLKPIEAMKK
ncbi:MAG: FtsX-like permease family protein [Bacteroidota bacterium]